MSNSQTLLTYSPLADRKQFMLGVHLRVHDVGSDETSLANALNSLVPFWPEPPALVMVDFAGAPAAGPSLGWRPPESTVLLSEAHLQSTHPSDLPRDPSATRGCLVLRDSAHLPIQQAAYFAIPHSRLPELPQLVARLASPVVVLDLNEPIDSARAANGGAAAVGGWSCLGWKRRPADRIMGLLSNILKLLQLMDKDADTGDLEAILKRDAVLSYKLVSIANSAAFGLAVEVSSLRHALSIFGRQRLKRWLSLLLVQAGGSETPQVLVQVAFIRAAFLERLGSALGLGAEQEDLFLCGAFSLLDKILGIPLAELLGRVSISEAVTDALVGEEGPLAPLLGLLKGVEASDADFLSAQCELLSIRPREVNLALISAISGTKEVASL
ncbi:MAG: HDOD domain-containing protein [Aeromicrobium sp.]|nr:HDOD domain-containing protein [Burkholderiales bacterium]